jgi:hypothetical protein
VIEKGTTDVVSREGDTHQHCRAVALIGSLAALIGGLIHRGPPGSELRGYQYRSANSERSDGGTLPNVGSKPSGGCSGAHIGNLIRIAFLRGGSMQ